MDNPNQEILRERLRPIRNRKKHVRETFIQELFITEEKVIELENGGSENVDLYPIFKLSK